MIDSPKQLFVMTVKSPIPEQEILFCPLTIFQWIVAWIILYYSYAFKDQDKLVHQNKCVCIENINFIWKPLWKHTFLK